MNMYIVISLITFGIGFILGRLNRKLEDRISVSEISKTEAEDPVIQMCIMNKGKSNEKYQRFLIFKTRYDFDCYKAFQEYDMSTINESLQNYVYVNGHNIELHT